MKLRKFYGLYDEQLDGFKAGITGNSKESIYEQGANRVFNLASDDELEGIDENLSDRKICELFDYSCKEITKEQAIKIKNSDEVGLLTIVSNIE